MTEADPLSTTRLGTPSAEGRVWRMNLGCGRSRIPGYLGVDANREARPDVVADATRLPFRPGVFHDVHASHVLEHIPDLPAAMREIHRLLAPGGRLEIYVPHGLYYLYDPHHLHPFSRWTLTAFTTDWMGYGTTPMFSMEFQESSNWRPPARAAWPFTWHLRRYLPGLYRRLYAESRDGRARLRVPLGVPAELHAVLVKRWPGEDPLVAQAGSQENG